MSVKYFDYGDVIVSNNNPKISITYETPHFDSHRIETENMSFSLKCLDNSTDSELNFGTINAEDFHTIITKDGTSIGRYVSYGDTKILPQNSVLQPPNSNLPINPSWKSGTVLANTKNTSEQIIFDKFRVRPLDVNLQVSVVFNINSNWFNKKFRFTHSHNNDLKQKTHHVDFKVLSQEKVMINNIIQNNLTDTIDVYESKIVSSGLYSVDQVSMDDITFVKTVDIDSLNLS